MYWKNWNKYNILFRCPHIYFAVLKFSVLIFFLYLTLIFLYIFRCQFLFARVYFSVPVLFYAKKNDIFLNLKSNKQNEPVFNVTNYIECFRNSRIFLWIVLVLVVCNFMPVPNIIPFKTEKDISTNKIISNL